MITVECIDELADARRHPEPRSRAITRRAMNGEIDFRAALEARVALLAGLPVTVLDEIYRERRALHAGRPHPGPDDARARRDHRAGVRRLRAVHRSGARRARLRPRPGQPPGGRRPAASPAAARADARPLEQARAAQAARPGARPCAPGATLAVGDGANDLPMLAAAGLGVAFRAHPVVRAATPVAISVGDLSALLFLQGIPRRDFVAG